MIDRRRLLAGIAITPFAARTAAAAPSAPLVLAAASLQESMTAAAAVWANKGHPKPVISFAASSALARQIEAGGAADLFVSADEPWMDDVAKKGMIRPATRISFLANRLVLIAPVATARMVATSFASNDLMRSLASPKATRMRSP